MWRRRCRRGRSRSGFTRAAGRTEETKRALFPGLGWLRQPTTYSDREWILAIAKQYRQLDQGGVAAVA